jgi:hypothetical protein
MDPLDNQEVYDGTNTTSKKHTTYLIFGLIAVLVIAGIYFVLNNVSTSENEETIDRTIEVNNALSESVSGSPEALQEFITKEIAAGNNDDATKAAVYWVSHRYFDNGGNIYEIYNFIEAAPEVAFLKEAENIYPDMFATIKSTEVANWSYESLMALLAYYEIIDRNGYADISLWGTAANKYAEQAYKNIPNPSDSVEKAADRKRYYDMTVGKSTQFLMNAHAFVINNTMTSGSLNDLRNLPESMLKDNILVGLNQYASAIQNLKGAGAQVPTQLSPIEIFEFNSKYAEEFVPRLYLFTNYLYATALVYGGDATPETVALPLKRAVDYMTERNNEGPGTIQRIINSKTAGESGVFQYSTTKTLAELNPEFKAWLKASGWKDSDF